MIKHNKTIAALVAAGGILAMSGAAHAISPAAALGLAAIGGAAVGGAAAQSAEIARHDALHHNAPQQVTVVPATPSTVVMGAPAATTTTTTVQEVWVPGTVTHYDHDGDGVMNNTDRFPNDPARS